MRTKILLSGCLTVVLIWAGPAFANGTCVDSSIYGAVLSQEDIDNGVKALPPEALVPARAQARSLARVMLRNLPAVAQQGTSEVPGSPGTCEAQSFGYGLGSYTAARDSRGNRKWNASLPQNSISAAYLYTLIHSQTFLPPPNQAQHPACPTGSRSIDYLNQLTTLGAPSRMQIPYQPTCDYLNAVNIDASYPGMDRFRIGSYAVIPVSGNPATITQIKSHRRWGQAVAFTGSVLCNYATPAFEDGVIYERQLTDKLHGQMLVGYDDTLGKPGEKGALLVQNSFGTQWPPVDTGSVAPPGKAYWSYGSFTASQQMAAVAYPRERRQGAFKLKASVTGAPEASLGGARQWAPSAASSDTYLILTHVFAEPVKLSALSLIEPGGTRVRVTAVYGQPISSGYSYLKRTDGNSFLPGAYEVELQATNLDGEEITYRGRVAVGRFLPADRAKASMSGVAVIGPTGAPASVVTLP
jgi:hypothetical protein